MQFDAALGDLINDVLVSDHREEKMGRLLLLSLTRAEILGF